MSQASSKTDVPPAADRPGGSQRPWLVLAVALLGWMFDGMEMGLFSVVLRPALRDLLGAAAGNEGNVGQWASYLLAFFLLGAAGGGLLFGWLGDRVGRVRAMAGSVLAYSCFTGACYFATHPLQLGVLWFLAALGLGGQWSLGVALVLESWPEKRRPLLAGVIGAAANVGYLSLGIMAMCWAITPASWRWVMAACASPALLALIILGFVPESQRWRQAVRKAAARPLREIFGSRLAWPAILGIAFASVALIGTWGCVQAFLPTWADQLAVDNQYAKGTVQALLAAGAILGTFISPLVGGRIGRRPAYFGMCLLSLVLCQILFRTVTEYGGFLWLMAFLTGGATASFYGWLPLYLPELFPTRVRATGQGMCYNFGRIFAMIGVLETGRLMRLFDNSYPRACATISLVYVAGMVLIWLAPETKGRPLPE
jgi:MFS family permease